MTNEQNRAEIIGRRLAELRGHRSQHTVAHDLGISPSAVGMYETGQRIPRDGVKMKMAEYFGQSVEEIFYK